MSRKFQILVCRGPDCGDRRGSLAVHDAVVAAVASRPSDRAAEIEVNVGWHSCFGQCAKGVNVLVRPVVPGENSFLISMMPTSAPGAVLYHLVRPEEASRILDEHVHGPGRIDELVTRADALPSGKR